MAPVTWLISARHHFTGQVREVDIEEALGESPDPLTSAP